MIFTLAKAWLSQYALMLLGSALIATTAFAGVQTYRLADARRLTAEADTRLATAQLNAEQAAKDLSEEYRRKEMVLLGHIKENEDASKTKLEAAQAAAARADATSIGLRQRAAQLAASCRQATSNPSTPGISPAPDTSGDLLADMLGRIDLAAGEIGKYADQLRVAGEACITNHETLRKEYGD